MLHVSYKKGGKNLEKYAKLTKNEWILGKKHTRQIS